MAARMSEFSDSSDPRATQGGSPPGKHRGKGRGTLDRDRVLDAAIRVADREGLGALSMRHLAQELGVEAMSLYHHVKNKEDLLDGMVDRVFAEIELPAARTGWRNAMRRRAIAVREAMRRHPWALGLMESRSAPGPGTIGHHDAVIGFLRRGGFTIAQAAAAFSVLDSYIYGFVMQEQALPFPGEVELADMADSMLAMMPVDQYPYFTEMIVDHAMKPGYSYGDEFLPGLDLILDGLERLSGT